MADEPDNLVLEHLRHIGGEMAALRADVREVKSSVSGILQILAADQSWKLRVEDRLQRIETRLNLVDPAVPG
jgi:hypothetical protein